MTSVIDGVSCLECHRPDGTIEYIPIPGYDNDETTSESDES